MKINVAIVGAGIGGLTCAIACRRANRALQVTVIERTPEVLTIGAGIHIPPNASRILAEFGLLEKLKEAGGYQPDFFRLRRYSDGRAIAEKPLKTRTVTEYGAEWIAIHRGDYQRVLMEEASALGVRIMTGAEVVDIVRAPSGQQNVVLKDGSCLGVDVVIGADVSLSGLWSRIRDIVLDRSFSPAATGDLAYRGTFTHAQLKAQKNEKLDDLLQQSDIQVWLGSGKHAVFYPLRNRKEYNLVLIVADDLPPDARTLPGNSEDIAAKFVEWDPILADIISIMNSPLQWKLFHFKELDQWTKGTITLMGDASHPTPPYQGQGAAMAVEDGAILGLFLGKFQKYTVPASQDDKMRLLSSLFGLYEDLRKDRTKVNVEGAVHTRHYYHLPDGPEQRARDKALAELPLKDWKFSCSFNWGDAEYQRSLLGFDVLADAVAKYDDWQNAIYRICALTMPKNIFIP
ncbi:salicylate hydroxylase [Penicillium lagena]|uniref:salicylate hydroxylase n=1 Tax=Penicillium lagena TaxID=94218 RepID=UPI00254052BD|nr:salicylate hydroxylase [Penicillium lagena]KAJ5620921.1 salicylate hydroxylase [Penicillium lagena]